MANPALPSEAGSNEDDIAEMVAVQPDVPDSVREDCCAAQCEAVLEEDAHLVKRMAEIKAAISGEGRMDKKREIQFHLIRTWCLGYTSVCFQFHFLFSTSEVGSLGGPRKCQECTSAFFGFQCGTSLPQSSGNNFAIACQHCAKFAKTC